MSDEKILLISDSLEGPTGFATNALGVAWSLAKEFDVHVLGLQSNRDLDVTISIQDEDRKVYEHANVPRNTDTPWDFGSQSLPILLDKLEPEILLTVNDIQMVQHIPKILYEDTINLKVLDMPAKQFLDKESILMQLEGELEKFKEKYPRDTKWIMLAPQDGEPPIPNWKYIYSTADKVVAMSKYGQKIFKKYFNMNVPYIYHGVDTNLFKKQDRPDILKDKFVVGDINRNQPRKQPVRVIQAFAKFAKDKPDALLHLQMDWNDRFGWPLLYFVNLYNIGNKIIRPRPVGISRDEVSYIYNSWDVNIMTTGGEGFGLPFIEAGAVGTPSIANDYTTSKELLIDGKPSPRGLLTDYYLEWQMLDVAAVQRSIVDIDSLVDTMNKYYYNRDLLEEHSKNAEKWTRKNVSLSKLQFKWIDLVKNVLNKD